MVGTRTHTSFGVSFRFVPNMLSSVLWANRVFWIETVLSYHIPQWLKKPSPSQRLPRFYLHVINKDSDWDWNWRAFNWNILTCSYVTIHQLVILLIIVLFLIVPLSFHIFLPYLRQLALIHNIKKAKDSGVMSCI